MDSLYRAKGYREFITEELEKRGRGAKSAFAEALGVQMSYLWAVFNGKQDFTPDQLLASAEWLQLNASETEWFMALLNRDRAASVKVRDFYQLQLNRLSKRKSELQKTVRVDAEIQREHVLEYYADWRPLAVTMALRNPETRTVKTLAARFQFSPKQAQEVLAVVEKAGLTQFIDGEYRPTQGRFHIGTHPLALKLHHTHWRLKAVEAVDRKAHESEFHYSSVMSIDESTAKEIKAILMKSIQKMEAPIEKAQDQEVVVLSLDLFKI